MTEKEFLLRYRKLTEQIRQYELDIIKLEAEIEGLTPNNDGMPRGSSLSDPTARLAAKLADLKADRLRAVDQAWNARNEIEQAISSIEDVVCSRLLFDRYVLCMTWREVSDDLQYDPHHVSRYLHKKALKQVREKLHCFTPPSL